MTDERKDVELEEQLEKEIEELKKAAEDALYQIRVIMSELENPFKYIAKLAPRSKEVESPPESEEERAKGGSVGEERAGDFARRTARVAEERRGAGGEGTVHDERKPILAEDSSGEERSRATSSDEILEHLRETMVTTSSVGEQKHATEGSVAAQSPFDRYFRGLLVTDFLVRMFGKDAVRNMFYSYLRRGLIDEEIYFIVMDALERLNRNGPIRHTLEPEDHVIAIYLLNQIKSSDPLAFYILMLLIRRVYGEMSLVDLLESGERR